MRAYDGWRVRSGDSTMLEVTIHAQPGGWSKPGDRPWQRGEHRLKLSSQEGHGRGRFDMRFESKEEVEELIVGLQHMLKVWDEGPPCERCWGWMPHRRVECSACRGTGRVVV